MYPITSSWARNAITASYALNSGVSKLNLTGSTTNGVLTYNGTGGANVQNNIRVQSGYVILSQVSSSLNFINDSAAAAGGVPLGGLYRNGNSILIRIS